MPPPSARQSTPLTAAKRGPAPKPVDRIIEEFCWYSWCDSIRPSEQVPRFPSACLFGIKVSMATQETLIPKKRRGPAPTGQGKPVQVRLHEPQMKALDAWRARQAEQPTRPEAIRRLVEMALKREKIE